MASLRTLLQGFGIATNEGSIAYCGVTLIQGRHTTVVDVGHIGRQAVLQERLAVAGIAPGDVDRVVLTHAHWDHCHNLQLFPNAEVFLHEDELAYSRAPHPEDWATPVWTADILGRCRALTPLRDGDELEPGVRVMATPGHSPGSMSVLVETPDGLAGMVGDALPSRAAARILAPRLVFFDVDVARASARRIVETCRFIYPGHDRPFRVEHGAFVSLEAQRVTVLSPPTDDDGTVQAVIDPAPSDPGPVIVPSARVPRGTA